MKSVAVVGSGAAGLVVAKVLSEDGFQVTIFEREKELGGIWSEKMAYLNLHNQQPGGTMEFADLYDGIEYATWEHTNAYLNRYADHFRLRERIQLNTRVISIDKDELENSDMEWSITTEKKDGSSQNWKFHFVVIATGLHSEPYMATIEGEEKFAGPILPPCAVKNEEQLHNKRVAIIGGGKCATDMAVAAGTYARSCHLIFRCAHWTFPRYLMGGRLAAQQVLSRSMSWVFRPFPYAPYTRLFRFLHETFPRLFIKITDQISADMIATHGPDLYDDQIFLPQTSVRNAPNISMIPEDFIRLKHEGRIIGKLTLIDRIIDETTIQLASGEQIQADLIICATGFQLKFPFFSERLNKALGLSKETEDSTSDLNLYRRMIPIKISNIAFLGFSSTVGQWMLNEVSSHWISDYFLGRISLPLSENEMKKEIEDVRSFLHESFNRDTRQLNHYWLAPIDILLNDMGVSMHRTSNWISEYFGVYRPQRFKGLHQERKAKAQGKPIHRFYFGVTHSLIVFLLLISLSVFCFKSSK